MSIHVCSPRSRKQADSCFHYLQKLLLVASSFLNRLTLLLLAGLRFGSLLPVITAFIVSTKVQLMTFWKYPSAP